jgi:MFS family permease
MGVVCTRYPNIYCRHTCTYSFNSQVLANLLGLAAVCPFVGSLSDLFGRRYVAIAGASLICLGMIVSSTAHTMNNFIGG